MSRSFVTEMVVLPDEMRADDPEMRHFALYVRWMGPHQANGSGGYGVTQAFRGAQLSRRLNWNYNVRPFQRRLYRWKTAREALEAAHKAVNDLRVNNRTYAEVRAARLLQEKESA